MRVNAVALLLLALFAGAASAAVPDALPCEAPLGAPLLPVGAVNSRVQIKATRHGTVMYLPNDYPIGSFLHVYGEWAVDEVALFEQLLRPGDVVVDAGANIGLFTLDFARIVGPLGAVLAFEPLPLFNHMLGGNVALNGAAHVRTFHAALSDSDALWLDLPAINFAETACFSCTTLIDSVPQTTRAADASRVRTLTLDSLELARLDMLKVDVEGMELEVLRGARATIDRLHPVLYVENNRDARSPPLVRYIVEALGYDCHWHFSLCFDLEHNYFGNREQYTEANCASVNMVCTHPSAGLRLEGLDAVSVPQVGDDVRWLQEHQFF